MCQATQLYQCSWCSICSVDAQDVYIYYLPENIKLWHGLAAEATKVRCGITLVDLTSWQGRQQMEHSMA